MGWYLLVGVWMLPWCQLWHQWPTNPSIVVGQYPVVLQDKSRPTKFWTRSLNWLWWYCGQWCIGASSSSWTLTGRPCGNPTPITSYRPSRSASYPPCSKGRFWRSFCPCDACSEGSEQHLYSRWDCDWVACSGHACCWSTSTKCWDIQGWPSNNLLFAHQWGII